jgi:membrane protease YdiL (CAAX protease family)
VAIGVALAIAAALIAAAWADRARRGWAVLTVAGAALYFLLRLLPRLLLPDESEAVDWNWTGHLLALAGMLALAQMLRRAGATGGDLGFRWPAHAATACVVGAAALLASYAAQTIVGGRSETIPETAWLFVATMPGLAEETAFRGVLLAAADRAAPAARVVLGVPVSAGAALLTAAFVVLHGFSVGMILSVLPGALLYLWLRLKTGSLVLPIVAHNLWNLIVLATHR